MGNPQERQAGASGSTMGYGPGQAQGGQAGTGQAGTGQAGTGQAGTGQAQPETRAGAETYRREYAGGRHAAAVEHRGAVVTFTAIAGTLMLLSGLWSIIVGIAALSTNHVYVHAPASGYTYSWSLHGWGWAEIILGIVVFAAGVSVFLGMAWARYVGAVLAAISAIGNFMFIPFTPLWSIIVIVLDAFVIWALLRPRQMAGQF